MKHTRKILSTVLAFVITSLMCFSTAAAQPSYIHQTVERQNITSGAVHERITRFTRNGWLGINVLRVNLGDPYTKVDTLYSSESVNKLATTGALAKAEGAVAAINAGFFEWDRSPGQGGIGYNYGTVIKSGEVATASSGTRNDIATFTLDKFNKAFYNNWQTDMSIVNEYGDVLPVVLYNKRRWDSVSKRWDYSGYTIIDRKWRSTSIGSDKDYPDLVEMVVNNGIVQEIRQGQPAVEIPKNGYVVLTNKSGGSLLRQAFYIGSPVHFNISTVPNWTNSQMSITGGTILLSNGNIPSKFTHIPEGSTSTRNPRTAIGTSKDGKELIMVTVDGRQEGSIGMTLNELAAFMKEIGVYNAINLDGGGSTTMVARPVGMKDIEVVNSPSEGAQRKVSNAIGVFSLAPVSELDGIIIDTVDKNVFVNSRRAYTVRGYDRYFNPVEINPEDVEWSVSGVEGTFEGNVFYPTSVGSGKIKATVGNVSGEIEINSLSAPVELSLEKDVLKLNLYDTIKLNVRGKNKNGYYAQLDPDDVKWEVDSIIGSFYKSTFIATFEGSGYITASLGNVKTHCLVSISMDFNNYVERFEKPNGSFVSYPADVTGAYEISSEKVMNGKASGKLTYDFPAADFNRAAYIDFNNEGISIDPKTNKLGIWVHNDHENTNWLGAWVYDGNGNKHQVYFTKNMNWTGWKYVSVPLEGISKPVRVDRIYVVQTNPIHESGTIYFDDLNAVYTQYPDLPDNVPADTQAVDPLNKEVAFKKGTNAFRFAVFSENRNPETKLEKDASAKLVSIVNKDLDASVFIGSGKHEAAGKISKKTASTANAFNVFDHMNSRFITLDTSKKGIRSSNANQWDSFLEQLNSFNGDNVFIFMTNAPDTFTDKREAALFQDVLTEYKQKTGRNVWVVCSGKSDESYMERGVHYVKTSGLDAEGFGEKNSKAAKYVQITVQGKTVTFQFKPVL